MVLKFDNFMSHSFNVLVALLVSVCNVCAVFSILSDQIFKSVKGANQHHLHQREGGRPNMFSLSASFSVSVVTVVFILSVLYLNTSTSVYMCVFKRK